MNVLFVFFRTSNSKLERCSLHLRRVEVDCGAKGLAAGLQCSWVVGENQHRDIFHQGLGERDLSPCSAASSTWEDLLDVRIKTCREIVNDKEEAEKEIEH